MIINDNRSNPIPIHSLRSAPAKIHGVLLMFKEPPEQTHDIISSWWRSMQVVKQCGIGESLLADASAIVICITSGWWLTRCLIHLFRSACVCFRLLFSSSKRTFSTPGNQGTWQFTIGMFRWNTSRLLHGDEKSIAMSDYQRVGERTKGTWR